MIIQSSTVQTGASRRYQSTASNYVEHSQWDNATGASFTSVCSEVIHVKEASASQNGAECALPQNFLDVSENSFLGEELPTDATVTVGSTPLEDLLGQFKTYKANHIPTTQEKLDMVRDIQQQSLDYLLRILFGDDWKKPNTNHIDRVTSPGDASANNEVTMEADALGQPLGTGGKNYSFYYYAEHETTCFDTTGTAITADGRELKFNISLEMSRSFTQMMEEKCDFGQPRLCDPMVINLNTNVASLSDQKFFFDIDVDGEKEEISMLDAGSGYLALDKNEDGTINDGSELFGTTSGNGFADLFSYDEDGNGWIDEADSIFKLLKIWTMDENGNSTLLDLKEAGVGALYLGYENTQFSLNNEENQTNGVIQKTGLFLFEDGEAGTLQQLDLAV